MEDLNVVVSHEAKLIDKIAYFKFLKGNGVSNYYSGLEAFQKMIIENDIKSIMVVVEDDETMYGKEMQEIWLQTGEFADQYVLTKWGVVVPNYSREVTIEYLVQGGKDGVRNYDYFISDDEDEILNWCKDYI